MVRFKVIKGSHLLMWISAVVLISVLLFILISSLNNQNKPEAQMIQNSGARAISAFAPQTIKTSSLHIEIIPDEHEEQIIRKRILIYHTHSHEAYQQDENNPYQALEAWRTLDEEHSVVRVGASLADHLRSCGYTVIHDTTDHELDSLNDSYVRSLKTLESYKDSFDLCIDLHRDAYTQGVKRCLKSGDQDYAQLMMLVGRGDNYSSEDKPDYDGNLDFAQRLTNNLNRIIPGICRNVTVKSGRYNQHIGKRNLLIEIGHNMNSKQEALNSIPALAQGIHKTLLIES